MHVRFPLPRSHVPASHGLLTFMQYACTSAVSLLTGWQFGPVDRHADTRSKNRVAPHAWPFHLRASSTLRSGGQRPIASGLSLQRARLGCPVQTAHMESIRVGVGETVAIDRSPGRPAVGLRGWRRQHSIDSGSIDRQTVVRECPVTEQPSFHHA